MENGFERGGRGGIAMILEISKKTQGWRIAVSEELNCFSPSEPERTWPGLTLTNTPLPPAKTWFSDAKSLKFWEAMSSWFILLSSKIRAEKDPLVDVVYKPWVGKKKWDRVDIKKPHYSFLKCFWSAAKIKSIYLLYKVFKKYFDSKLRS